MRDQRDPALLGAELLRGRRPGRHPRTPLSRRYDGFAHTVFANIPDTVDVGPTERYGDPRQLPSTLPN